MNARNKWILITIMLLAVIMAGCLSSGTSGGGPKYPYGGSIVGVVADQNGARLADVRVLIPNTIIETRTNGRGEYELVNIPPGTYPVIATKPGYRMESFPLVSPAAAGELFLPLQSDESEDLVMTMASSFSMTIEVKNGKVQAPMIRMLEYDGTADDLILAEVTPGVYSSFTVGDDLLLQLEVQYKLASASVGSVAATVSFGSFLVGNDVQSVTEGSGTVSLRIPMTIPNISALTLQVALFDQSGALSVISQPLFDIIGYQAPQVPQLRLESVTPEAVVLAWDGPAANQKVLQIYRQWRTNSSSPPGPGGYGHLVAEITDLSVTTWIDTDFVAGDYMTYLAHLTTIDGQQLAGSKDDVVTVHTLPQPYIFNVGWNPSVRGLLYDPVGELIYATRDSGRVTVLSAPTGTIVDNITLGCTAASNSHVLSADGTFMYFLCIDERLGIASLPGGQTTYVPNYSNVIHLDYDDRDDVIYFATRLPAGERSLHMIPSIVGAPVSLPISAAGGLGVVGDLRLLVAKPDYTSEEILIYDLDTLEVLRRIPTLTGLMSPRSVRTDGRFLYIGTAMYSLPDLEWYGYLNFTQPFAVSNDGRYLASRGSSMDIVAEWNGYAWSTIARLSSCGTNGMAFSLDGRQLYAGGGPSVCVYDLTDVVR